MTPDQQKDAERLDRYIAHERLSSVMNEAKWREAMSAVQEVMGHEAGFLRFRVKCVRDSKPYWGDCEGIFPHFIPRPYKTIEWLDINPVAGACSEEGGHESHDFTEALIEAFQAKSIPLHHNGTMLRLQGYTRSAPPAA